MVQTFRKCGFPDSTRTGRWIRFWVTWYQGAEARPIQPESSVVSSRQHDADRRFIPDFTPHGSVPRLSKTADARSEEVPWRTERTPSETRPSGLDPSDDRSLTGIFRFLVLCLGHNSSGVGFGFRWLPLLPKSHRVWNTPPFCSLKLPFCLRSRCNSPPAGD
jgi:hypothetical protein